MPYEVEMAPSAQRDLRRLPSQARNRLVSPIQLLSDNPQPRGVRKIRGQERAWRIRTGPYRIIYDVYDDQQLVVVFKVDRRRETTYRDNIFGEGVRIRLNLLGRCRTLTLKSASKRARNIR